MGRDDTGKPCPLKIEMAIQAVISLNRHSLLQLATNAPKCRRIYGVCITLAA
jgi:hypothetical protein